MNRTEAEKKAKEFLAKWCAKNDYIFGERILADVIALLTKHALQTDKEAREDCAGIVEDAKFINWQGTEIPQSKDMVKKIAQAIRESIGEI